MDCGRGSLCSLLGGLWSTDYTLIPPTSTSTQLPTLFHTSTPSFLPPPPPLVHVGLLLILNLACFFSLPFFNSLIRTLFLFFNPSVDPRGAATAAPIIVPARTSGHSIVFSALLLLRTFSFLIVFLIGVLYYSWFILFAYSLPPFVFIVPFYLSIPGTGTGTGTGTLGHL